ncbi:MAG: dihydroneopterin aldolase [Dehalococcoidia bacterium]|nr:dihydroneopterin aldolase [Dehalococcoidia bacterium]
MDRVLISDLAVRCIIGVNDDERREKQDVLINLTVFTDMRAVARSDSIEDAVDYRDLRTRVVEIVERSQFCLLEALAQAVADVCLEHPGVSKVMVRIDKPGALRSARSVAVEIERERA